MQVNTVSYYNCYIFLFIVNVLFLIYRLSLIIGMCMCVCVCVYKGKKSFIGFGTHSRLKHSKVNLKPNFFRPYFSYASIVRETRKGLINETKICPFTKTLSITGF